MFAPTSVALVGASPDHTSTGYKIAKNLLDAHFRGRVAFVNPKHREILGRHCAANVRDLTFVPDLAVVAVPPAAVPTVIADLNVKGTRAVVVITAGLSGAKNTVLEIGRASCLRILGPNCIGLMLPHLGLNASFAQLNPAAGSIAFVSQSGALLTTVIDWAATRGIGFSHVVSLGDMSDVDFGDMLDYLAADSQSRAILLYMESVTNARKFMSAARRAARTKPVVIVKSGRHEAGAKAAFSHTGALAGSDAAYDAAFRRAGLLRVRTLNDLFAAAETIARAPRLSGERLAILTNGGGAGVLATDELQDAGGELASLDPDAVGRLDAVLPPTWSHGNPIDIVGDATETRFAAALEALIEDDCTDAVLVIKCPTAMISSVEAARAVIDVVRDRAGARKPVLASWLGGDSKDNQEARAAFEAARIPAYETTIEAITGFMQLVRQHRARRELMETPPPFEENGQCATERVHAIIMGALKEKRGALNPAEGRDVLAAYGIPVNASRFAKTDAEVAEAAREILGTSRACVVKIASRDISHKSDVGGVRVGLESVEAAVQTARDIRARVKVARPDARIDGFTVEPMIERANAQETIVGMSVDPTFGPLILFGAGGTSVEVLKDRALGLPPLNMLLARQMIGETRISKLLAGYRDRPPADCDAVAAVLVRISELVVEHPEIREIDINPLLTDESGVIAIDVRMKIADNACEPRQPLSIRPYPQDLQTLVEVPGKRKLVVRPVRPDDERLYHPFFEAVSADDLRMRFFTSRRDYTHEFIATLTQIDYAREMALIALPENGNELYGVARLVLTPDGDSGEFGVLVRSDLQGKGIGWQLMHQLIAYARKEGVRTITGLVLRDNATMLRMAERLSFAAKVRTDDPTVVELRLDLSKERQRVTI